MRLQVAAAPGQHTKPAVPFYGGELAATHVRRGIRRHCGTGNQCGVCLAHHLESPSVNSILKTQLL